YDLVRLTTRQGRFTVSKDHRVAVPGPGCQGAQRADQLSEGDLVIVGGKNQKLTKVSHLQECTVLYEVVFEEDQSVQMFHIESYGLVTSGSAVAAESAASAPPGRCSSELGGCWGGIVVRSPLKCQKLMLKLQSKSGPFPTP
ncbi:unnamed protein product, partial [Effrenium voratum]